MNFPDRFSTFPRLTLAELPKKTVFQKTYEISGLGRLKRERLKPFGFQYLPKHSPCDGIVFN